MILYLQNHFLFLCNEHAQSTSLGPKVMFGVVSRHFVAARDPLRKRVSGWIHGMSLCPRNHFLFFRNEHAQSTSLGPKLMFGVVSCHFVAARDPLRNRVSGWIQGMNLCPWNHFMFFHNEHAQFTSLGPKLMFGVVSRHFVAACDPLRKRLSGCIQGMSLCSRNHFLFFRNEQSTTLGPKLMFGVVSRHFVAAHDPLPKRVYG